jgi:chemotaxis protein CheY-P-specific phosphatase CheC/flagellar motor switch/type III secretory pathway protein FliN
VTDEDPLIELAEATSRAVVEVLAGLGMTVEVGKASILARGTNPLEIMPLPAVISRVAYVGGVSGGNVFTTTVAGANQIAAIMGAGNDANDAELSEIAQSAFGEAANQMLASAAGAASVVLGRTVEMSSPETIVVSSPADVNDVTAPHMTRISFTIAGETCLFVQLIPHVFVLRMSAAREETYDGFGFDEFSVGPTVGSSWLHDTQLRLDAELGSSLLTADEVLGLRDGAVVVLDRSVDDPIELFVNGAPYAHGRLLVDDGEWAVVIDGLLAPTAQISIRDNTSPILDEDPEGAIAVATREEDEAELDDATESEAHGETQDEPQAETQNETQDETEGSS